MRLRLATTVVLISMLALAAHPIADSLASLIPPPAGAKVAVILFQDLEWPDCATAYPVLRDVAKAHNVPLVIHDFPLPRHTWSFQAAVNARFFDLQPQKLGDEFRGYILQNQKQIGDETELQQYTAKFAAMKQIAMPAAMDPQGKLAEMVQADFRLGQRIGLEHTPTVFVVSANAGVFPLVETIDRQKLDRVIEEMQQKLSAPVPAKAAGKRKKAR